MRHFAASVFATARFLRLRALAAMRNLPRAPGHRGARGKLDFAYAGEMYDDCLHWLNTNGDESYHRRASDSLYTTYGREWGCAQARKISFTNMRIDDFLRLRALAAMRNCALFRKCLAAAMPIASAEMRAVHELSINAGASRAMDKDMEIKGGWQINSHILIA